MRWRLAECQDRIRRLPYAGQVANSVRETAWLGLLEAEAVDGLRDRCGAGPQCRLAARIAGLEREAELLPVPPPALPPAP